MEGKTVILSVLIMSLVMAQIQLGAAKKICCPSMAGRKQYEMCLMVGSEGTCVAICGCRIVDGSKCPPGIPRTISKTLVEYCKLGCASSVCGAIITLQNSDVSEIVNGAVEQCSKACASLCTKGSTIALKTA